MSVHCVCVRLLGVGLSHFFVIVGRLRGRHAGQRPLSAAWKRLLQLLLRHVCHPSCRLARLEQLRQLLELSLPTAVSGKLCSQLLQKNQPVRRRLALPCTPCWHARQATASSGMVRMLDENSAVSFLCRQFVHVSSLRLLRQLVHCRRLSALGCTSCARGKASSILMTPHPAHCTLFCMASLSLKFLLSAFLSLLACWHARQVASRLARTSSHCAQANRSMLFGSLHLWQRALGQRASRMASQSNISPLSFRRSSSGPSAAPRWKSQSGKGRKMSTSFLLRTRLATTVP